MSDSIPSVELNLSLDPASASDQLPELINNLPAQYFEEQRWYGSKGRQIESLEFRDAGIISGRSGLFVLCLVDVGVGNDMKETYFLPLELGPDDPGVGKAHQILRVATGKSGVLVSDAFGSEEFRSTVISHLVAAKPVQASKGVFEFGNTTLLTASELAVRTDAIVSSRLLATEQSNTSVVYEDSFILKAFRRLQNGPNPDLEIPLFLTSRSDFQPVPSIGGFAEYLGNDGFRTSVFALQSFVPNLGDGWRYTLDHLASFFENLGSLPANQRGLDGGSLADAVRSACSEYLDNARRLGDITADLHSALEEDDDDPEFAPELITDGDVGKWAAAMEKFAVNAFDEVWAAADGYPKEILSQIGTVVNRRDVFVESFRKLSALADQTTVKIRHHGDYHLGQVLKTSDSFVIIDFEGEPARPLAERREKQCPLRDVGGMLRSFDYAVWTVARDSTAAGQADPQAIATWAEEWERQACDVFLDGYLARAGANHARSMPHSLETVRDVIVAFQVEKAIYEVLYELRNRPSWLAIPLRYLARIEPPT